MAEVAPSPGGGANRTFLLIIGGLAALLFLGLLALGALFILPNLLGGGGPTPVAAVVTMTPTRIAIQPTATRVPMTNTPVVVATNTVVLPPTATEEPPPTETPVPEITATPVPVTATPLPTDGALPDSGLGEDLMLLGGGLFLLLVIVMARRARTA